MKSPHDKPLTLKEKFFDRIAGDPNAPVKGVVFIISLLVLIPLAFYEWGMPYSFFMKETLLIFCGILCFAISIFFVYRGVKTRNPYYYEDTKTWKRWGKFLAILLLLPLLLYALFILPPASFLTRMVGRDIQIPVYFNKENDMRIEFGKGSFCNGYEFINDAMKAGLTVFMPDTVCITMADYNSLPSEGGLVLIGRESFLGRVIDGYFIPRNPAWQADIIKNRLETDENWRKGL